jgi:RNA polymerase sigma factor (sigma-70 family)
MFQPREVDVGVSDRQLLHWDFNGTVKRTFTASLPNPFDVARRQGAGLRLILRHVGFTLREYFLHSRFAAPEGLSQMCDIAATARSELNGLLHQTGCGDRKAFAELYKRTASKLFGMGVYILHDRSDAEEVLQEVYIAAWQRSASFDASKGSAITWLLAVTRNKAIDRLRLRHPVLPMDSFWSENVIDLEPSPNAEAESGQKSRHLLQCLKTLEPRYQASLRAAFFGGVTYKELALQWKVLESTMKSQIRRSLMKLRVSLVQLEALPIKLA